VHPQLLERPAAVGGIIEIDEQKSHAWLLHGEGFQGVGVGVAGRPTMPKASRKTHALRTQEAYPPKPVGAIIRCGDWHEPAHGF
jgi:hypothetical protein